MAKESEANRNIENTISHGDTTTCAAATPRPSRSVNSTASVKASTIGWRFRLHRIGDGDDEIDREHGGGGRTHHRGKGEGDREADR